VDISYRVDGQLEFMPNTLQNVPAGAIILFIAPAKAPFYLYEMLYNTSQNPCASRTRINGLINSDGTSQIYVVASGAEPMAHFACPVVALTCVCKQETVFMLSKDIIIKVKDISESFPSTPTKEDRQLTICRYLPWLPTRKG
jgi:hypothetical protein